VVATALLSPLVESPALAAVLLDVDGTLAPIVERPQDASVPESTRAELRRLARRYGLVACVSGRPSADARRIVGVDELVYAGEHGLELAPEAAAWEERLRSFVLAAPWPAEDKRLTASFHFRDAADPDAARAQLEQVAAAARQAGFRTRWGRMVLELSPPVQADKGTAIRSLLADRGLGRALYAGDDATDLDGFQALAELEVGIRIAVASAEAPLALLQEADLVVDGPAGLVDLLREL
jgi:trehalose 6-phosphate phosphatase